MFAWKYLLQICQKDHIPCSVCSLEETYSLIWFLAFIFLKGTNDNYCLLWSVIFSMNNSPKETSAMQMSCDSRQYASIFCIHTWVERAGTDCPASQCSPRDQDHISKVFPGFGGYFVAFSGVLNCGWPWHSIFMPEGGHVDVPATKYFLAFSEVSSPNMTCLYVQGPFTSMFSRILSLATLCTSYSARETGFCLCPAKLGWQPIDPAC